MFQLCFKVLKNMLLLLLQYNKIQFMFNKKM